MYHTKLLIFSVKIVVLTAFSLSFFLSKPLMSAQDADQFPYDKYKIYNVEGDDKADTIKDSLKKGVMWEGHITELLRQFIKVGSVVVDAGAHIGTHTVSMAHCVGEKGVVWAFEPQGKIYQELVANVRLNGLKNVQLKHNALGNETRLVEMLSIPFGNEEDVPVCPPEISVGDDKALMITLDSLYLSNVSLIKIDVEEGSEDLVLEGARETIKRNRPVIIIEICGDYNLDTAPEQIKLKAARTQDKLQQMNYVTKHIDIHNYLAVPAESLLNNSSHVTPKIYVTSIPKCGTHLFDENCLDTNRI